MNHLVAKIGFELNDAVRIEQDLVREGHQGVTPHEFLRWQRARIRAELPITLPVTVRLQPVR